RGEQGRYHVGGLPRPGPAHECVARSVRDADAGSRTISERRARARDVRGFRGGQAPGARPRARAAGAPGITLGAHHIRRRRACSTGRGTSSVQPMITELDVEVVLEARAQVGEGPVWDERTGTLVWVDIMGQAIHVYDPATGQDLSVDVGQPVGAAAPRESGGLVLALRDGFATLDADPQDLRWVAGVEADVPTNRMNDGKCDAAGRFWAGTMAFEVTPGVAGLYRLDPDYQVTRVVSGITLSNGLDWSLDNQRMYYIDSV